MLRMRRYAPVELERIAFRTLSVAQPLCPHQEPQLARYGLRSGNKEYC